MAGADTKRDEPHDSLPIVPVASSIQPADTQTISPSIAAPGVCIGPYLLLRLRGEGGMGIVYEARQLRPFHRNVALKIIKPGMDTKQVIGRFETERQALALMDHPNIARVYDAGSTDSGLPYFVMELVDGVPITQYCDSKRLSVKDRIKLLIPVCEAIQHAHQKGIIHRDIKPSNILVTESEGQPTPKVIDFGLAKALGQQLSGSTILTNVGTIVGTLDYMSPEQTDALGHDVDTRSDVYSLGAVLYELLTGTTPLQLDRFRGAGYIETLRRIRDEDAQPPSERMRRSKNAAEAAELRNAEDGRLRKLLGGDLDWIAIKALEKDRTRRYETVNGLKKDLGRYLVGEPVEAAPPSTRYKARKFLRKYKSWVAAAAAFAALLISAVVLTSWLAVRARQAQREAIEDRNALAAVNDFLQNDLLAQASTNNQISPDATPDADIKVRTVLDRAAARIDRKFRSQPPIEASVRLTIGTAYFDLGLYAEAFRQVERAVELRQSTLGPRNRDTLSAQRQLAVVYREQGQYPSAEALLEKVVRSDTQALGPSDPETLRSMEELAGIYRREGKLQQAEAFAERTLKGQQEKLGSDNADTLETMNSLAAIYTEESKYSQAEPLFLKSLGIKRRIYGPDHPLTLATMSDLSVLYAHEKKHREEEELKIQTLEACRRVLGPEHPYTLQVMSNLAVTYSDEKKYAESEALNLKTLEIMRRVLGAEHPSTLTVMNNLGVAYKSRGKYVEAEALDRQVLLSFQKVLGPMHPNTVGMESNLALDDLHLNRYQEAEALFRKVLKSRIQTVGARDASVLRTAYHLAWTLHLAGRDKEAESLLREDLAIYEASSADTWERARCQSLLGSVLLAQRRYREAEPLLREGVQGLMKHEQDIAWYGIGDLDRALGSLVSLYRATGNGTEAAKWEQKLKARGASSSI